MKFRKSNHPPQFCDLHCTSLSFSFPIAIWRLLVLDVSPLGLWTAWGRSSCFNATLLDSQCLTLQKLEWLLACKSSSRWLLRSLDSPSSQFRSRIGWTAASYLRCACTYLSDPRWNWRGNLWPSLTSPSSFPSLDQFFWSVCGSSPCPFREWLRVCGSRPSFQANVRSVFPLWRCSRCGRCLCLWCSRVCLFLEQSLDTTAWKIESSFSTSPRPALSAHLTKLWSSYGFPKNSCSTATLSEDQYSASHESSSSMSSSCTRRSRACLRRLALPSMISVCHSITGLTLSSFWVSPKCLVVFELYSIMSVIMEECAVDSMK